MDNYKFDPNRLEKFVQSVLTGMDVPADHGELIEIGQQRPFGPHG